MGLEDVGCFFQNGFPFWGTFVNGFLSEGPEWLAHELSPPPPEALNTKNSKTEAENVSFSPNNNFQWMFGYFQPFPM